MKAKATIRPVDDYETIIKDVQVNVQFVDVPEHPGNQDVVVFYEDKHYFMRWSEDMKNTTRYAAWPVNDNEQLLVVELAEFVE
jgi:hypothetical protein